jgi:hypothetical protein
MIERYSYVMDCINECRPKTIADIGVWNGRRSAQIIRRARELSSVIQYYGFDLWEDLTDEQWKSIEFTSPKQKPSYEEARQVIQEAAGSNSWTLIKGNTRETLPNANLPSIDFAFIDGGHSLETIDSDWKHISCLLHEGSIVLFDDYWHGRLDAGCCCLIDGLESKYNTQILGLDIVGPLRISMAKVTLRKNK